MLRHMIAWDPAGPLVTTGQLSGGSVFYFNRAGLLVEASSIVQRMDKHAAGQNAVAIFRTRQERDSAWNGIVQ